MGPFEDDELSDYEVIKAVDREGNLRALTKVAREDIDRIFTVRVNGVPIRMRKAVIAVDEHGNPRRDERGLNVLRRTTLYDAICKWQRKQSSQGFREGGPEKGMPPVPLLCHREHLTPVGVCRVCSVLVRIAPKDGKPAPVEPRLVPACCTEVWTQAEKETQTKPGTQDQPNEVKAQQQHNDHEVWIDTHESSAMVLIKGEPDPKCAGEFVRSAVGAVVQLLRAANRFPGQPQEGKYRNELDLVARQLGLAHSPQPLPLVPKQHDPARVDTTSLAIVVDHNNCILCNRCVRSCTDVRPFAIVGQSGKGATARISFDINKKLGESDCVSCGECMVSCPTGALTFRQPVPRERPSGTLLPDEVLAHPLFLDLPWSFLKWNEGAVVRLNFPAGTVVCEQGRYGNTAYVIVKGRLEIRQRTATLASSDADALTQKYGPVLDRRGPDDLIVGEMSPMSDERRSATIVADQETELWEINRNVLLMLQRNRKARRLLDRRYCKRALQTAVNNSRGAAPWTGAPGSHWLFGRLSEMESKQCVDFLSKKMRLLRLKPGQMILRQGDEVDPQLEDPRHGFFVIRSGFVDVKRVLPSGAEVALDILSPGDHFGEIALLTLRFSELAHLAPGGAAFRGFRTSTCRTLDHVELVHIPGSAFLDLLLKNDAIAKRMRLSCREMLEHNRQVMESAPDPLFDKFIELGLYQGQNLFSVDLEKCTRCLECVTACGQAHKDGVTRIVFTGDTIGRFLIPSACRSCHDPLCLKECPVDAIHRTPTDSRRPGANPLAIVIENWCIGCSLCEQNCPYGSIHMAGDPPRAGLKQYASNCDLCVERDSVPRCVYACPHDAAKRDTGMELAKTLGLQRAVFQPAKHLP